MNKYSLRFIDNLAEQSFQEFKLTFLLQPVFQKCSEVIIIQVLISMIIKLAREEYRLALIQIVTMVYMLLQLYIIKKKKNFIIIFLGITNVVGVIYEFSLTGKEDPYYAFLFGGNVMIAHCIYLFASDFIEGLIQGLFICSGKIIMTVIYSSYPNREINLATLTYFLLLEVLLYKCNQGLRQFYLLSLKSDQWQKLLIRLVDKHFICFYYDDKSLSFQQILTNNETINMKHIFRESKHHGQSVENLLFKLHKSKDFKSLKIDAIYNNRNIAFQLSQFHLDKPCYLVIIDYYEIRQDLLINKLLIQNICQSSKLIRLFIKNKDWCILNRLYLRELEIINLYKCVSKKIKVREFNLTKLLRRYSNILRKCHNDTKMFCFINDDINIQYFKEEMKLFFIRIFNQIKPNNSILKILMIRDNDRIKISIDGYINPNFIQSQSDLIEKIFDEYKINENCKFYIIIRIDFILKNILINQAK